MRDKLSVIDELRACKLCEHELPAKPRPVFQFSASARVLVVGQAPGIHAHNSGLPFNDSSGDRLRRWLGTTRQEFYDPKQFALLPMAFCYPGAGMNGDLPPPKRCAAQWRTRLLNELKDVRFTLLCGRYAIESHYPRLKNVPLRIIVKQVASQQTAVMATPHPSGRNNRWFAQHSWFDELIVPKIRDATQQALA